MKKITQAVKAFIDLVEQFKPFHSGPDLIWFFYFRGKKVWSHIRIQKYENTYYMTLNGEDTVSTEDARGLSDSETFAKRWTPHLKDWIKKVKKDPIEAQAELFKSLPMNICYGVLPRKDINFLLPQWYNFPRELSKRQIDRLITILERTKPEPIQSMTQKKYFEYCRIAYEANPETFKDFDFQKGLSGFEYYKRYADGRCGTLLKIDPNSEEEFSKWYSSSSGDHPWEIYRGGNSTHINLFVIKEENEGWRIGLEAFSSGRLVETCKIALAFDKANLPFEILHSKSYIKRLRDEDLVGIIPKGAGIKYAWHDFPKEWDVADCIYLDWLLEDLVPQKRSVLRKKLRYLVHWLPEKITAWLQIIERKQNK